jgi:hypothetical protein
LTAYKRIKTVPLTPDAPATVRRLVASLIDQRRANGQTISDDAAGRVALVASELVAEAAEHGSDAATIHVDVTDDAVIRVEVFDGPRRRWIVTKDDRVDVARLRAQLVIGASDGSSSADLGDGHFTRCEIHYA